MSGLADAALVGFVTTTDLGRAEAFYRDVLGLRHVETGPYAAVFDAGGTMLRVTLVRERAEAPYTVLGWRVDDIAATIADLAGRGVEFRRYDGMGLQAVRRVMSIRERTYVSVSG
jgi:catechol 2,3-dioxygenase-like lactoylglutathione lyase family enzyme